MDFGRRRAEYIYGQTFAQCRRRRFSQALLTGECLMSKLIFLAIVTLLVGCASTPPTAAEVPGLIATCNIATDSNTHEGRALRACDRLAKNGRLSLAEPDAVAAYSKYQRDLSRWQACEAGQWGSLPSQRGGFCR